MNHQSQGSLKGQKVDFLLTDKDLMQWALTVLSALELHGDLTQALRQRLGYENEYINPENELAVRN